MVAREKWEHLMIPAQSDLDHAQWFQFLSLQIEGKRVLDLGSRTGYMCNYAFERGASACVGVDVLTRPNEGLAPEIEWIQLDLNEDRWSLEGHHRFDIIFGFDVIEHVNSAPHFLQECYRWLSPQGLLLITTPNTNSWERLLYPDSWSGAQDPQHLTLFNCYSLEFMLKRCGFQVKRCHAPIRALKRLGTFLKWGGQIYCVGTKPSH